MWNQQNFIAIICLYNFKQIWWPNDAKLNVTFQGMWVPWTPVFRHIRWLFLCPPRGNSNNMNLCAFLPLLDLDSGCSEIKSDFWPWFNYYRTFCDIFQIFQHNDFSTNLSVEYTRWHTESSRPFGSISLAGIVRNMLQGVSLRVELPLSVPSPIAHCHFNSVVLHIKMAWL